MNEMTEQIWSLQPGDHLCLIYEKDPAEQMPVLIPFIKQGLAGGERCIYIADDHTVDEVARTLEASGVEVDKESERGALLLWTRKEWRQPGDLDSERKALQVGQFVDAALTAGFKGIRFGVEMTWTLGPDIGADKLRHWEATINRIFVPGFPGRIICQYNRSRLAPTVVETCLSTHPMAVIGNQIYPNFFYEAPLILSGESEAAKVDWKIAQLKKSDQSERERIARRDQERGRKLQRIYQLNHQVNRAEDLEEIYKVSLDIILQSVKADRAAILLYDDDQVMRFKAWQGISDDYRRAVEGHSPWRPDTPDPQPVSIPDIEHAPLEEDLREVIRREGICALGFFPLTYQKRLLGKFMVYYDAPHAFLEEEVHLSQTIAGHIAFSLQNKMSEEALRHSQERLNIALSAGRMGAWEWDIRKEKIAWTPSLEAIHHLPEGTFGGRFEDFKRGIHPEDLDRVLTALDRTLIDRSEYRVEYRILSPGRKAVWLESRGELFLGATGEPERMIGVSTDVTERKEMETKLRRSEQNLTDFFENAAVGLHWVGSDGIILRANRAEMEMLGYRPDEYIGHHIAEFHADREVIDDILQRLSRGETLHSHEARLRCKDGAIKHVLITSNVYWEDDRFIHTRCVTRDITDRKKMEEELKKKTIEAQEASRIKSQLVSNVSHELRTPLNAILGYTHLVLGQIYGPVTEDQKMALDGVLRNSGDLLNLINNILDLSKIESGKASPEIEPVTVSLLLDEVLTALRPLLNKSALSLRYDSVVLPVIQSDAGKIKQIFVNLLSNAIKFTPQGEITVRMNDRPERSAVEIDIQDTGIGIQSEDLSRIFDRFHQVDGTATREFEGSGLGLAIVKQLVNLLKGEISVKSEFGKGSTFTVLLPYDCH
jgi:PAS domain S-box-containing protein